MLATREHLTTLIREQRDLGGLHFRGVRAPRALAMANDADIEKVKAELGDAAAAARVVPGIWATGSRADDGDIIHMQPSAGGRGMMLDRFRKAPAVLWNHREDQPKIGDAVVEVDGDKLRALVAFMPRDLNPLSWSLGEVAATRGYAASIWWRTERAIPAPDEIRKQIPWAIDILESTLLEGSVCNIAVDENSMHAARAMGVTTDPIASALEQAIAEAVTRGDRAALERMWAAAADPARAKVIDVKPTPAAPPAKQLTPAEIAAEIWGQLPRP